MKPKNANKKPKTATKLCPVCVQQIPVACKACTCGHVFKKPMTPDAVTALVSKRRRTERVKRGRPNYFNSLEYVTTSTPRRRRTTSATSKSSDTDEGYKKKRGRPRQPPNRHKDEDGNGQKEEEDPFASVSAEKALQYSLILAEINRRYAGQNFKPC